MAESKNAKAKKTVPLTGDDVADYLRRHPEFLLEQTALFTHLAPPKRFEGDNVADLQQFMVRNLQDELQTMRDDTDHLIHTTRSNMTGQTQTHMAVLALLDAEGLDAMMAVIDQDIPTLIGVDAAALIMGCEADGVASLDMPTLPMDEMENLLGGQDLVLRDNVQGDPRLYNEAGDLIRSDALVRIEPGNNFPEGLLALGARHPATFHSGQGTELLIFLGEIIAHCLTRWLTEKA